MTWRIVIAPAIAVYGLVACVANPQAAPRCTISIIDKRPGESPNPAIDFESFNEDIRMDFGWHDINEIPYRLKFQNCSGVDVNILPEKKGK
jgi:hypothetical protein